MAMAGQLSDGIVDIITQNLAGCVVFDVLSCDSDRLAGERKGTSLPCPLQPSTLALLGQVSVTAGPKRSKVFRDQAARASAG
jgi:hypothetical protein